MTIADFVSHLQSLDVRLSAEGERLRLNAPPGVLSDSLRRQVAERKQELLVFLRDNMASAASTPPPVVRRTTVNPVPLSFAQERLWFLEQLEPGSPVYNLCRAYRLMGKLNLFALAASLNEIVRRHEVLRSVIRVADSQPAQVVQPPFELNTSVIDLLAMTDVEGEKEIRRRIQQAAEKPFDFAAGKFFRAELLRLADDEQILILTAHHIVSDAWSMGILTRELWSLYEAYAAGKSFRLEELPVQYADFAVWQREYLQGHVLEAQLAYWKKQLSGLPNVNLPTDRLRPPQQSFRGARLSITLQEALTAGINNLSNECGVTPFMTLLAAFQVLLYRYSGQEEIVVGSPIANRRRSELEPLIGFFVNTLVLRTDLSGNPTFEELLVRIREVCLGAYAHQDLPFEKLVQELQPERDQSRNPLFQVMFVLQNATRPFTGIAGLRIEPMEIEGSRSQFDLSIFLRERERKYIGYIEYCSDLFDCDRIERMAGHYQTLLEGIIANPEQPISSLPILTDSERHQILLKWNQTAADYPKQRCIHQLFEEQADRTPDAIALEFEGKRLTYGELNARANQLGHFLISLGIGPEALVGICIDRSVEMLVGLLGILKAGAAYVPLDPAYPRERLDFILQDAQVLLVVTQDKFFHQLQESASRGHYQLACLDRHRQAIERQPESTPRTAVKSNNLAYIIYTSGSTGAPKGVAIEHRSVLNCLHSIRQLAGVTKNDALLAVTTISFDIAGVELYLPWMVGARVVLASREESLDGRLLLKRLKDSSVTLMQATPSTWKLLLEAKWQGRSDFRVLCGGETLSSQLADKLVARGPAVWNLYGPTETTIWSTAYQISGDESQVPIGRPLSNTRIYILDAHQQLLPIGIPGEVHIGGAGVARGYLNQTELTAERFIANPFSSEPRARLYRTGDLARYRADGTIEFLGRIDTQVKIRGHRVELGEIEHILNQHPAVEESAVVARERESSEEKDLVGYIIPSECSVISVPDLRALLSQKLPSYMIPSAFVVLDALPRTLSGKIDRSNLPSPHGSRSESNPVFVEPRSEIEELVAQIWREVLKLDKIGIHDNFFELGGHSLLATQVIVRLGDALNREVPLKTLFDSSTIARLVANLGTVTRHGNRSQLPPIVAVRRDSPLPLSMNQEHLWRLDQMIPGTHFFNMPYVYRLSGKLNVDALTQAIKEIVRRHEVLRTVFSSTGGNPVQIIKPPGDIDLSFVDLRPLNSPPQTNEAARLIVNERTHGFDLAKGPLLRTKLLQLTATESLVLLTLHHIISDEWSIHRIRDEIISLYAAFCRKEESGLPEPTIQFADYAAWERKVIREGLLNHQISYWKEQLSVPSTVFVSQAPRPSVDLLFCREPIGFDADLWRQVRAFAQVEACTPFMIMIAVLSVVIYAQTKKEEIRIGILVANRARRETEQIIGHLTNTLVLRIRTSSAMTFDDLLTSTRRVMLLALAHEELPFQYLVQNLEVEQASPGALLFETLLMYQRNSPPLVETPGLELTPLEINQEEVKADLVLSKFPLIIKLRETSTTLTGTVNYKVDSFNQNDVLRMTKAIDAMVRRVVSKSIKSASVGRLASFF